jgi:NADP-dependent 3-hydroxy acid dehydrogenase YdfG
MGTRRVVVTGASAGIGEATVTLFREHGWDVVAVARRRDRLEALAERTGAAIFVADLSEQDQVDALRDYLKATGTVHALVNNAGSAVGQASVEDSDPADWIKMFDINFFSVKRLISALLPLLRIGAKEIGHADILTVTSIAARLSYEGGGGYNASKAATKTMLEVLRLELAGEPIRVVEIAPGTVRTEFVAARFDGNQEKADAAYAGYDEPLLSEDLAREIVHAIELPGHVNLDLIIVKPVSQAAPHKVIFGPLKVRD